MGKYTIYNNSDIDNQIDKYLKRIKDEILLLINPIEIKAIILAGGFGRGEGGIWYNNGIVKPVNDFDIIVFPKRHFKKFKKKYFKDLNKIAEKIAIELEIKQIDINIGNYNKFYIRKFFLFYTVNTYEIVNGHIFLFGNININRLKNSYNSSKIPLIEGLKYLFTRGSGLLIAVYVNLSKKQIPLEIIYNEINKCYLAFGDSYLILKKQYHYSYAQRINIASLQTFECPNGEIIKRKYIDSLNWKLKPEKISADFDLESELKNQIKLFIQYFLYFEQERLKVHFNNIYEYYKYLDKKKRPILWYINKCDYFFDRMKLMLLLFASIYYDDNYIYLKEIETKLKINNMSQDNNSSIVNYLKIFIQIFHNEGYVKRILQ
jgi:hypothetical protein